MTDWRGTDDHGLIIADTEQRSGMTGDEIVTQAIRNFAVARDERIRAFVDAGISMERLSFVTLAGCKTCRGFGSTHAIYTVASEGSTYLRISECPECPGLCLDGKPIVHPATV